EPRRRRLSLRHHGLPPHRPQRAQAAAAVARPLAELRQRPLGGHAACDPAPGLRPGRHPLRPRQQLRAAVRPGGGELRPLPRRRLRAVPRRAGRLHQGRLRHVARPVRPGRRLAQVRAGQPRPVAGADGARLRRHLLQPPLRPRDPPRGDRAGPRHRGALRPRAVRRHLVVLRRQDRGGGLHRPRARHAAAHPPAVVLHAQPLDRGLPRRAEPPRRARGPGHGLHRLHRAGTGPADRPLPRRGARRLASRPRGLHDRRARRGRARPGAGPGRGRAEPRAEAGAAGPPVGAARPPRDVGRHRRLVGRAARHQPRRAVVPRAHRRRAGRDRQARGRVGRQPVGEVDGGV
ncbi:MAG: L-glyceraldehyde 3-phosphate reductase, partial [uncultured Nocardioides sp.]